MTILDKIAENALKYPDRIAYYTERLYESEIRAFYLTWKELNEFSDKLAAWLDDVLRTKTPIIVYGHKSPYMIVCFLACVKSGRAYCPVDISVPLSRVESIINEVKPEIILTTEELPVKKENVVSLKDISAILQKEQKIIDRKKFVAAEDIFYIIFTSGSTGTPKGVQITRDCLDNFINWGKTLGSGLKAERHYTFINQAPFSFDLSVMDLYLSLYAGGTLWALDKKIQNNMKLLLQSFEKSGANVWVSTPSFADVCLSDKKFSREILPELELLLFCGETLTNQTAKRLQAAFPKAEIVNTYGPTESTVAVTEIKVTPGVNEAYSPLPVGKEKPGTWILIMDENGQEVPEGEKGEIVIVGDSVSLGYWNNRKLTEKAFGKMEVDGREYRFYRTGDKGYKTNGLLFYCGRIDLQVKLHGYRIEIEDIESNIMRLSYIRQAAVMPVYHGEKVRSLMAYVSTKEQVRNSFEASQTIRSELKQFLPDYMIPKKIVFLEAFPMTNNGKVDRKALGGLVQ